ncbi:MAG: hypothetical protein Q4P20_09550 [Eubacteriales bacterium]|nr:hypothetical protein [Eubacteriales bacterium]
MNREKENFMFSTIVSLLVFICCSLFFIGKKLDSLLEKPDNV